MEYASVMVRNAGWHIAAQLLAPLATVVQKT